MACRCGGVVGVVVCRCVGVVVCRCGGVWVWWCVGGLRVFDAVMLERINYDYFLFAARLLL